MSLQQLWRNVNQYVLGLSVLGLSHHLMTTPNSTISEPYKHLTIAKAYVARQIAPWRKRHIWVCSVLDVSSGFGFGQRYHVDRYGQFTLKLLRLSVLNEMHTNSYSGPRLITCADIHVHQNCGRNLWRFCDVFVTNLWRLCALKLQLKLI